MLKSYKFIDTKRFSPVIYGNDLPWEEDYFHLSPNMIDKEFLKTGDYLIDEEWWLEQRRRCIEGYTVHNAFVLGGDCYTTERLSYQHTTGEIYYYGGNIIDRGEDGIYLVDLDITIKNGSVTIPGRMYFYLNFWIILRTNDEGTRKQMLNPKFTDLSFENWWIRERMRKEKKDNLWCKVRQKGYQQPNSEPILTDKGWKKMGDIKVGDLVATNKNSYTKVSKLFPQGISDVYEIELMDGRKTRCGIDHLWKVYDKRYKHNLPQGEHNWRILNTKQLLEIGLSQNINKSKNLSYRFCLPDIDAIEYKEKELPINPYLLGILLGDGTINKQLKISSKDKEILDDIQDILGNDYKLNFDEYSNCNYRIVFKDSHDIDTHLKYNKNRQIKLNPLKEELKQLGLLKCCLDKFIPDIYKHGSIKQRLMVIRGLMDSDGYISKNGIIEFKNCSPQLTADFVYILRSLGIHCKVNEFESPTNNNNYFRVYIKTTKYNLFKLNRKASLFQNDKNNYKLNPIISIKKLSYQEDSTCIMLDDDNHIYLTRDFIPTHNSQEEACDTGYDFVFLNDSQTAIVGGQDIYNENTMKMVREGLKNLRNTQFYKELMRGGDSEEYIRTANTGSEVHSRTAKNNAQVISGLSPSKAHLEEIGIWTRGLVTSVRSTVLPSIESEGNKTGYITMTGTGGDMEDGVADMEKMVYNPRKYGLLEFNHLYDDVDEIVSIARYVPGFRYKIIDSDGNSLCLESIKTVLKQIDEAEEADKYNITVMNALKLSHIFYIKDGGYFGKHISQICNERKAYINTHREAQVVKRYRADLKDPKNLFSGIEMVYDADGPFMIAEMPERDNSGNVFEYLYRAGTDSYDQDEAAYSTSKGACWIKKGFLNANTTYNKYVAGVVERPSTSVGGREIFYRNTAILCIFYNAINLIEWSKILIFKWYEDHNCTSLLKLRPEFVTANMVIDPRAKNKYGIDPSTKSHWLAMQKTFLEVRQNIDKCDFIDLLEAWAKFKYDPSGKKYNCDNTIASSLCTVCEEDEKELAVAEVKKQEFKPVSFSRDSQGNIIYN